MKTFVFGLQRTATNYVHSLLWKNFGAFAKQPSDSKEPQWKHNRNPEEAMMGVPKDSLVVVVAKDPVMWTDSLVRKPMDAHKIFEGGDEEPSVKMYAKKVPLSQVVEVWNDYNLKWSKWHEACSNISAVRHDTLLDDSKRGAWLDKIAEKYDLEYKGEKKFDNKETPLSRKFTKAVKDAYLNKETEHLNKDEEMYLMVNSDMETYLNLYE